MTHRARLAIAAVVLALFGGAVCVVAHHDVSEPPSALPAVLTRTEGDLRYTYHVATGVEGLYDVAKDPRLLDNLAAKRPEDLKRMREAMRRNIGVDSLDEIRRRQDEMAERLRGLGYVPPK